MAQLKISRFAFSLVISFSLISLGLSIATLIEYLHQREHLIALVPKAQVNDRSFIIVVSYHIFASIFVATVFGTAFALSYLQRVVASTTMLPFKLCIVPAVIFLTADALALTIITASKHVTYGNVGPRVTVYMDEAVDNSGIPLYYSHNTRALVAVCFTWLAWACTLFSCVSLLSAPNVLGDKGPLYMENPSNIHGAEPKASHSDITVACENPEIV